MSTITTEQVKELRDKTGVSVMQCKKALEEAEGNMEKALLILKKKSSEVAEKKSDRDASAGTLFIVNGNTLVTLNCETDFVAKNDDFVALTQTLAEIATNEGIDAMKEKSAALIGETIQKVGENIKLGDVVTVDAPIVGSYVHDGRVASLVGLEGGSEDLARDIAMHITAMSPEYKTREEISAEETTKVEALCREEVVQSGKPADIQEKMLAGKVDSFFKERTLVDQPFIKTPDQTIGKMLESAGATVTSFVRVAIG